MQLLYRNVFFYISIVTTKNKSKNYNCYFHNLIQVEYFGRHQIFFSLPSDEYTFLRNQMTAMHLFCNGKEEIEFKIVSFLIMYPTCKFIYYDVKLG